MNYSRPRPDDPNSPTPHTKGGAEGCWPTSETLLHEPSEAPPGFGVRQSSGALAMEASQPKAPAAVAPKRRYGAPRRREDWRSPRRYRVIRKFMVPMHAKIAVAAEGRPAVQVGRRQFLRQVFGGVG